MTEFIHRGYKNQRRYGKSGLLVSYLSFSRHRYVNRFRKLYEAIWEDDEIRAVLALSPEVQVGCYFCGKLMTRGEGGPVAYCSCQIGRLVRIPDDWKADPIAYLQILHDLGHARSRVVSEKGFRVRWYKGKVHRVRWIEPLAEAEVLGSPLGGDPAGPGPLKESDPG